MKRILLIAGALLLAFLAYFSGFFEFIFTPEKVKQVFLDLGILGPVAFILAIILLNPYFIPVLTFAIPASLIWDVYTLFFLLWLGVIGSCTHAFVFARYFARDYVGGKLPPQLRKFDTKIAANGFTATILIRLTIGLIPPGTWLLGLSQVRFIPFLAGTALGFLPLCLLIAYSTHYAGNLFGDWFANQNTTTWVTMAIAITAIITLNKYRKRRQKGQVVSDN